MKSTSIPRVVAISAMTLSAPLAVFGIHSMVTSAPHAAVSKPQPQVTRSPDGRRAEIRVPLGTGDDIARAIAALPASGGRVILEAGIYTVRQPLVLDRDDIEISGDQEQTVLQLADRADCPLVVIGPMETPPQRKVSGVALRKLILDGNRTTQDNECNGGPCDNGGMSFIRNNALTVRAAEDCRIEHVTARRARSGGIVLEKGCRRIHVSDFTSYDNHYDGFAAYETEESFFTRLYLHGNAAAGISADLRFDRNIISYARLENNGSQGIFMRDSNFNNFNHLTITGNGAQGVFIAQADDRHTTPCTGNIFTDLAVRGSKKAGLRVNDVSCIANVLANSSFVENGEGGVSEASDRLLAQQNVDLH